MCTPYMPYSLYALHTYTWRVCMPYMIDAGAGRAYVNVLLLYMPYMIHALYVLFL